VRRGPNVDAYLREQEREAAAIRARIEARSPQGDVRARLLARKQAP